MSGFESKTSRWDENDKPRELATKAASALVAHIKDHGMSEREVCAYAGVSKTTWRRATGRPYPGKDQYASLVSLRDFIAVAMEIKVDPAELLKEIMKDA